MNLLEFIRLIIRYWKALVLFPLMTGAVVFFLTRHTKKEYSSSTEVYTGIASGFGITSGEGDRVDYFAVNNAFDNLMATIKSRETVEEVGMRLLAAHLVLAKPSYDKLSQDNFDHLNEIIPAKLRKQLVVKNSPELTFYKIENYKQHSDNNEIIKILNTSSEIYSSEQISSNMSALRKQSSDMIDLTFKSNDPAVCQQTLQLIVDVVISRYKGIKGSETNNVVKYFEEQLQLASLRLKKSEDHLRDYSSDNKIINYYEQAKFIAESKENVIMDKQKQEMALEATRAALKKVEGRMDLKTNLLEVNEKITKLREQLAESNYRIANAELYNEDAGQINKYKEEAETLKKAIKTEVEKQYKFNNTTEGLPRLNLLNEWLTNYLAVDENAAKLVVIQKRLDGFDHLYTELAPIGSNLKRIEREVDINEKEYLSVLHGLNMARLRQQSLQMSNNLTITDSPYLPLQPLPSKRTMLVIMAFVATFIVTLAVLVAKSLLGKTIQTPGRAEKFTGLQFISAFPEFNKLTKNIIVEKLEEAILSHLTSTIAQITKKIQTTEKNPIIILITSNKKGEGKTFITSRFSKALSQRGNKTLWLTNDSSTESQNDGNLSIVHYNENSEFYNAADAFSWLTTEGINYTGTKYIIIEISELSKYLIPEGIVGSSDVNILVLDSERVWAESDSRSLSYFTKSTTAKSFVLLNKVEIDRLENIIGEIPKIRTGVRKIGKRIITFNFKRS